MTDKSYDKPVEVHPDGSVHLLDTDPIGTAQEVVMLSSVCGHHFDDDCQACVSAKSSNDARLQSRIAEVERLTDLLDRVIDLEASAEHLPEPVSSNLLTIIDEARAALSLQRRV